MPIQTTRVVSVLETVERTVVVHEGWCMVDPGWAVDGILTFTEGLVTHEPSSLPKCLLKAANPPYEFLIGRLFVPSQGIEEIVVLLEPDGPHPERLPCWKPKEKRKEV